VAGVYFKISPDLTFSKKPFDEKAILALLGTLFWQTPGHKDIVHSAMQWPCLTITLGHDPKYLIKA